MPWPEQQQLARKAASVAELLGRELDGVNPSPRSLGYRARISMKTNAEGILGYFQPRSHRWVGIPVCAIARAEINAVLQRLPALPGLPVVELRSDGSRVVLAASTKMRGKGRPRGAAMRAMQEMLRGLDLQGLGLSGVSLDGKRLSGECRLQLQVCGISHRLGPASFFQVNLEVNEMLVEKVVARVEAAAPSLVLDLYAGAGNLSLPLAARGLSTVLVEQSASAVADARATISRHDLDATVRRGDAGALRAGEQFFDVALLDPPRAGAPGLIPELLLTRPRLLVYVSCNPATLARDIEPARQAGYQISRLEVFDMFPQTDHIETLCVLERG
jgi:23S rRNA (uracil1939-C5)-methyltransferase